MKTIRRDLLRKLAEAGKLEMVSSYHYDDMGGESRGGRMPVRFSKGYDDFVEGQCNLREHDFTSSSGCAYFGDDEERTIRLIVHSNCSYEFRLKDGATLRPTVKGANKAKRPENARMQAFLAQHGIEATPKYLPDGSMRGCWRLYNGGVKWTVELAQKLNDLGFTDFDGQPLGCQAGNGGTFSVFVRGHNELLGSPLESAA